ncbi:MAG TPA: VOC family protein [Gemmatimonadaceae bacterium]|nr:VOC family protein [Gemmatimonadaceae bacterium]
MSATSFAQVGVQQCVPLLLVRSMEASMRFYIDGLGFSMTNQWINKGRLEWCWLQHGDAALMLQEVVPADKYVKQFEGKVGLGVSLNFTCRDALAFHHLVKDRGIETKRPFVGNRMWVTSLKDPDGYDLHFESPTDVAEETVYEG